jgi:hypothetical protein
MQVSPVAHMTRIKVFTVIAIGQVAIDCRDPGFRECPVLGTSQTNHVSFFVSVLIFTPDTG